MNNNIMKKILAEYQEKRTRALREAEKRREEIRRAFPRLALVQDEIYGLHLQLAKARLTGEEGAPEDLQEKLEEKKAKKNRLMEEAGLSEAVFAPPYACSLCEDRGYVEEEGRWVKCVCLQNAVLQALYRDSGILTRLKKENFGLFRAELFDAEEDEKYRLSPRDNILEIKRESLDWIEDFGNPGRKNLIFYGRPGTGKTFFCTCIAKELIDRGKSVFCQSSSELFSLMSDFVFSKEESERRDLRQAHELLLQADLLIIDDLGSELTNSFVIQMLFTILNQRLMNGKKMILSTNLSPAELHERYGERIASRLVMSFNYYRFFGKDLRWEL